MNTQSADRLAVGKGRFMQRQQDIGHLFDADQDVISLVGVDKVHPYMMATFIAGVPVDSNLFGTYR